MQSEVRRFRRADLKRILALEAACFPADAYPPEMFLDLYRECGALFFVAWVAGRASGYIVSCAAGRKAEIVSLAVAPAFRGRGVGSLLMGHTLRALRRRGIHQVWLMVRTTNTPALRFYRRFGFRRVRLAEHYYEDGGNAVRMRIRLP